jgi:hypothetical protein
MKLSLVMCLGLAVGGVVMFHGSTYAMAPRTAFGQSQRSNFYDVVEIGPSASQSFSYSVGVNSRGDVVGEVGSATPVPFLYRGGQFTRLTPPGGISQAQATGINDSDIISVQAHLDSGLSAAYAVKRIGKRYAWIRLSTGSLRCKNLSVANVAENGDVDGGLTLILPDGGAEPRSVIWHINSDGTYEPARLLPTSAGYVTAVSGGIWYRNGTSYVAGGQGDGGPMQDASLWSPTPELAWVPHASLFASTVGGSGRQVYAAGTSRSSTLSAWVSAVTFDGAGVARMSAIRILDYYPGYDEAEGEGVAVDARGRSIVVGDVASSVGLSVRGAMWRADGPPALLQSLLDKSPWTVTGASGVNDRGEIAAVGTVGGADHALLLRPTPGSK